ncbi:Arm DNA-binding domain-containing protein [Bacteroides acidifaciens]|uniref:Arm DNA-binding domain-containing protein n=1 Tax=Bacteroides acidifaciens TaxID=85831 RepID=UPI00301423D4
MIWPNYSICKCIRTDKPLKWNRKYPIYLRFGLGSVIPTNLDTFPEQWDKRKNEPKNKHC